MRVSTFIRQFIGHISDHDSRDIGTNIQVFFSVFQGHNWLWSLVNHNTCLNNSETFIFVLNIIFISPFAPLKPRIPLGVDETTFAACTAQSSPLMTLTRFLTFQLVVRSLRRRLSMVIVDVVEGKRVNMGDEEDVVCKS